MRPAVGEVQFLRSEMIEFKDRLAESEDACDRLRSEAARAYSAFLKETRGLRHRLELEEKEVEKVRQHLRNAEQFGERDESRFEFRIRELETGMAKAVVEGATRERLGWQTWEEASSQRAEEDRRALLHAKSRTEVSERHLAEARNEITTLRKELAAAQRKAMTARSSAVAELGMFNAAAERKALAAKPSAFESTAATSSAGGESSIYNRAEDLKALTAGPLASKVSIASAIPGRSVLQYDTSQCGTQLSTSHCTNRTSEGASRLELQAAELGARAKALSSEAQSWHQAEAAISRSKSLSEELQEIQQQRVALQGARVGSFTPLRSRPSVPVVEVASQVASSAASGAALASFSSMSLSKDRTIALLEDLRGERRSQVSTYDQRIIEIAELNR